MRLFTAILLEERVMDDLGAIIDKLRLQTVKGSFTHRENLHLTLNFIGETQRRDLVEKAMQQAVKIVEPGTLTLTIRGFGRFKRREGDICYIPIERNEDLWRLQRELRIKLIENGFDVDNFEYKPHLTLARRVIYKNSFDDKTFELEIASRSMEGKEICLMSSERIHGKLVYTKIFSVPLSK